MSKLSQSVHKVLEREIRPVEVQVEITTDEERWALRLVYLYHICQALVIYCMQSCEHDLGTSKFDGIGLHGKYGNIHRVLAFVYTVIA